MTIIKSIGNLSKLPVTIHNIDKVDIHSATDGAKQERAHEKEPAVTEGSQKGSWQIKRINNFGDDYNEGNFGD